MCPGQVAQQQRTLASRGFFSGKTPRLHGAQQNKTPRRPINFGKFRTVVDPAFIANELGVGFGQLEKLLRIAIVIRVSFAQNPHRRLRLDGGLRQFQHPLAFRDGGGANQPFSTGSRSGLEKRIFHAVGHDINFIRRHAEFIFHQMFFPFRQHHAGIGQPVGFPAEGIRHGAGGEIFHAPAKNPASPALHGGLRALGREQIGNDDLDFFLLGKLNLIDRHAAKIMNDVAGLVLVPPAERLSFHANFIERGKRALDLGGLSAMRKGEWQGAVEQDFHA